MTYENEKHAGNARIAIPSRLQAVTRLETGTRLRTEPIERAGVRVKQLHVHFPLFFTLALSTKNRGLTLCLREIEEQQVARLAARRPTFH